MGVSSAQQTAAAGSVPEDRVEDWDEIGPKAFGDPMGTPAADEKVLWKGRPDIAPLARTAFHTRKVGIYFLLLIGVSIAYGNTNAAIVCTVLGLAALAILNGLAWLSVRTTLYILTDTRLIMRVGMALETRINIPLKHVLSADLRMRGKSHGDIAFTLGGERLLGYALLWPHARPWKFASPQPMLRAVPDAQRLAEILAEACAKVAPAAQEQAQAVQPQVNGPANVGVQPGGYSEGELTGAHA